MYYKGTKTLISKSSFLRLFILFFIFCEITKWLFNFLFFLQVDWGHRFLSDASSFIGLTFSWIFLCVHLPRMPWITVDVWVFLWILCSNSLWCKMACYMIMWNRGGESVEYWDWSNSKHRDLSHRDWIICFDEGLIYEQSC